MSQETVVIGVKGMSCDHCRRAVEKAVQAVSGVLSAGVDLAAAKVNVTFDSTKADLAKIKTAIAGAGYQPL